VDYTIQEKEKETIFQKFMH